MSPEQLDGLRKSMAATWSPAVWIGREFVNELIEAAEREAKMREALEMIAQGPEPLNDYLTGIRCGVEDRCLQNSVYEAAEYSYEQGIDYCADIARQALAEGK